MALVIGIINGTTPGVRQFLGVPFAQPPVNDLRWEPPASLPANQSLVEVDASKFSLNCPQYESSIATVYSTFVREFFIWGPSGEDCLTLSIWAPASTDLSNMPVLMFLYGGGLVTGGSSVPYQNPAEWVQRTQAHIVVSIQYRLNIFGFPNAPGLQAQNLGYLDVRKGVEWVSENIAAFGGDPGKMVLWGQSAGAGATDAVNYAYADNPLYQGIICDSGTQLTSTASTDTTYSIFTFVAQHFNCSGASILPCMRNVSSADIETFLKSYQDSQVSPTISFGTVVDNTTVFSNYTQRLLDGQYSTVPAIYGFNDVDEISLDPFPADPLVMGANITLADEIFTTHFVCPETLISRLRTNISRKTYRYQYRGNFSNVSPLPWLGAYHSSELPMIFGTSGDFRGPDTPFETATSEKMQDFWLAFAADPVNGLDNLGWYESTNQSAEVFGGYDEQGNQVPAQFISLANLATTCAIQ